MATTAAQQVIRKGLVGVALVVVFLVGRRYGVLIPALVLPGRRWGLS